MKLICTMPCRNEDWVLGMSARAVLMWADELIILDHCSTDQTPEICLELAAEYPERVVVLNEPDPVWREMAHRQRLLEEARKRKASHILLVDADEILSGNLLASIRQQIGRMPAGSIFQLPWLCLRGSIDKYHAAGTWAQQDVSMAFVDDLMYHWQPREGYDHHHRHPMGPIMPSYRPERAGAFQRATSGLMHLQFVNDRRLRAKQFLYKLIERSRWPDREPVRTVDQRYNLAVYGNARSDGPPAGLAQVPAAWWFGNGHLMQYLHPDAEPWQVAECRRMIRENPGIEAGLDNFGVI